jgi:hypothetical protein
MTHDVPRWAIREPIERPKDLDSIPGASTERLDPHRPVDTQERARDGGEIGGEIDRSGDADDASRLGSERRDGLLGLFERRERVAGALVVRAPRVREREPPRRAPEETDAERGLERRHAATHRGLADA